MSVFPTSEGCIYIITSCNYRCYTSDRRHGIVT